MSEADELMKLFSVFQIYNVNKTKMILKQRSIMEVVVKVTKHRVIKQRRKQLGKNVIQELRRLFSIWKIKTKKTVYN